MIYVIKCLIDTVRTMHRAVEGELRILAKIEEVMPPND